MFQTTIYRKVQLQDVLEFLRPPRAFILMIMKKTCCQSTVYNADEPMQEQDAEMLFKKEEMWIPLLQNPK